MSLDFNRYENIIAQGCLTNSKHPDRFVRGVYPEFLDPLQAKGVTVYDTKENAYVDLIGALGANLIGYGNRAIAEALYPFLRGAFSLSLPTKYEMEFGEALKSYIPFIERIKILKSGTQACDAAIKIARAFTRKDVVLSEGYHGHGDDFVSLTPPALGIPQRDWMKKLDLSLSDEQFKDAAAVIVEPVMLDDSSERKDFLQRLREKCDEHNCLLIFDEIITGFRFKKWSVASSFRVEPDLIILGKALANGLPLGVVAGKAEIMDCDYFVSTTFAGEILSLIAATTVLSELRKKEYAIEDLWVSLLEFKEEVNKIDPSLIRMKGYATRGVWEGEGESLPLFMQECVKSGILIGPSWVLTYDHLPFKKLLLSGFRDIIKRIKNNQVKLEGAKPTSAFAARSRS